MTRNKRERSMSFCRNTDYFVTMMIKKLVMRKADEIHFSALGGTHRQCDDLPIRGIVKRRNSIVMDLVNVSKDTNRRMEDMLRMKGRVESVITSM